MPKSDIINVKIEPEFHKQLRRKTEETGIPYSVVIRRALEVWLVTGELPKLPEKAERKKRKTK